MSETRQRWRLVFARDDEARYLSHLDAVTLWERALRRGAIPVATTEGFSPRPRIIFAAPLQLGMRAEHELADLYLSERMKAPELRARIHAGIPAGYRVLDLHDVWTNAPAIAPQLVAADYRMTVTGVRPAALQGAVGRVLASPALPRVLKRENRQKGYDLRPLLLELRAREPDPRAMAELGDAATPGGGVGRDAAGLWMRLRHSQDLGSGRPDEVVAALADELGLTTFAAADDSTDPAPDVGPGPEERGTALGGATAAASSARPGTLEIVLPVRERLWLAGEV
jgi:radical SAM-linked protein